MKTSSSVVRETLANLLCMDINLTVQRQDDSYVTVRARREEPGFAQSGLMKWSAIYLFIYLFNTLSICFDWQYWALLLSHLYKWNFNEVKSRFWGSNCFFRYRIIGWISLRNIWVIFHPKLQGKIFCTNKIVPFYDH